jgi:hypothetical protein
VQLGFSRIAAATSLPTLRPVHQPDLVVGAAILIMGDALDERAGAIADADEGDVDVAARGIVEAHRATIDGRAAGA